ncbi:hypothetical protein FB451DRAFT_1284978 [Mycena latifolia]|nr:hypothetical protein FB451DRAFT_1284978 [Mycena latifolia]
MPGKHVRFSEDVFFPPTPSPTYSSSSLPSSYGPLTPPQQYTPYLPFSSPTGPTTAIHPILAYTQGNLPRFLFDVTLPPENIKASPEDGHAMGQFATNPLTGSIVLMHQRLAWEIVIKPSQGKCVTVADILRGIYTSLRTSASGSDFDALPTRAAQDEVTAAFARRWMRIDRDGAARALEKSKGLKRVDFLGSLVAFGGLARSPRGPNCWELVLLPAP